MDADEQCLSTEEKADVQCQYAKRQGGRSVTGPGSQSESQSHSQSTVARRWTVIASGLLLLALALVVIYTGPNAFYSPIALVVVAAIGLAALLLQVWFHRDLPNIHSPLWLNVLGIVCAMVSLFADYLHITRRMLYLVAFAAVVCFGISGSLILHALRRRARTPQSASAE
jgi:membrane-bound ClpP family serine protease